MADVVDEGLEVEVDMIDEEPEEVMDMMDDELEVACVEELSVEMLEAPVPALVLTVLLVPHVPKADSQPTPQ